MLAKTTTKATVLIVIPTLPTPPGKLSGWVRRMEELEIDPVIPLVSPTPKMMKTTLISFTPALGV